MDKGRTTGVVQAGGMPSLATMGLPCEARGEDRKLSRVILRGLAVATALAIATSSADAQVRFRIYDLSITATNPNGVFSRAFGINELGQVVGECTFVVDENDETHAFFRPTTAITGFGNAQPYDLSVLADSGFSGASIAYDINESLQIVGQSGTEIAVGTAFVWTISSGNVSDLDLGTLSGDNSVAYAVNDAASPIVAGVSDTTDDCDSPELGKQTHAFRVAVTGATMTDLSPLSGDENSVAYALDSASTPLIVGHSDECVLSDRCDTLGDGTLWMPTSPDDLISLQTNPYAGAEARGVNAAGNIVGSGEIDAAPQQGCRTRAAFWEDSTASPFNLGTVSGLGVLQETVAEAINDLTNPQVVGADVQNSLAMLWESTSPTSWTVTDLNDAIPPNGWSGVSEATDINDDGWIVGWGHKVSGSIRAFLLIPIDTCLADIDGDNEVDSADLAALLAAWNDEEEPVACNGGIPCLPDLNGDSVIDSEDLSELLAEWGPCEGESFGGDPFLEWALEATIEELMEWLEEHPNG